MGLKYTSQFKCNNKRQEFENTAKQQTSPSPKSSILCPTNGIYLWGNPNVCIRNIAFLKAYRHRILTWLSHVDANTRKSNCVIEFCTDKHKKSCYNSPQTPKQCLEHNSSANIFALKWLSFIWTASWVGLITIKWRVLKQVDNISVHSKVKLSSIPFGPWSITRRHSDAALQFIFIQ